MKAFKFVNLLLVILPLFVFNACTKSISEEQMAVEKQIVTFITSIDKASSQLDWGKITRIVNEYFAEDSFFRLEDPNRINREVQTITLQQYRRLLRRAPEVIIDYEHEFKDRKIEVAPDGKSAKLRARRVDTTTMDREAAVMIAPYLFMDKDMATIEAHVTIKSERQITIMFENRDGKLLVTQIDSKVIKMELSRI